MFHRTLASDDFQMIYLNPKKEVSKAILIILLSILGGRIGKQINNFYLKYHEVDIRFLQGDEKYDKMVFGSR